MRGRQICGAFGAQHNAIHVRQLQCSLCEALGLPSRRDDLGPTQTQIERIEQRHVAKQIAFDSGKDCFNELVGFLPPRVVSGQDRESHQVGGNLLCYRQLIESIAPEIAIIGIQAVIRDGQLTTTIPDLAAEYATELLRLPLDRRPHIAGWSMGGIVALELVHQLSKNGSPPASLALIDSYQRASKTGSQYDRSTAARGFLSDLLAGAPLPVVEETNFGLIGG